MEGNNTRVDAIEWNLSEMSAGNKSALVSSFMLHVKDKVNTDLPLTFWQFSSLA